MIKKLVAGVFALSFAIGAHASYISENFTGPTYYVDCNVATTGDGSQAAPFKTLQEALDAATVGGCTVVLAEGTYDSGVKEYTLNDLTTRSRGVVYHKTYLKGAGRDKTFIVGAKATEPDADGNGDDAVRCLLFDYDGEGSLVEGLTLKGGRTESADLTQTSTSTSVKIFAPDGGSGYNRISDDGVNKVAKGGAVFAVRETSGGLPILFVDVTFDDCRAGYCGGAVYGNAALIRCLVKYCRGGLLQSGALAGLRGAFSTIVTHNGGTATGAIANFENVISLPRAMNATTYFVNCTFASNKGPGISQKNPMGETNGNSGWVFYNCGFFDCYYRFIDNQGMTIYNCAMNTNGSMANGKDNIGGDWGDNWKGKQYWLAGVNNETGAADSSAKCDEYGWDQLVSIHYDFRPKENAFILDKGSTKWLTDPSNWKIGFIPTEYQDKDFKGDARIDGTRVAMGAYNNGVKLGVPYVISNLSGTKINGYTYETPNNKTLSEGLYGEPYAILTVDSRNGSDVFGFSTTTVLMNGHANSRKYLFPAGYGKGTEFLIRPSGDPVTYTYVAAANTKWVDPENGVDDSSHGTEAAPYRTLQYACTQVSANGVVYAKPGHYAEGEGASATDGDWKKSTKCRVQITKNLRLCGVEGAEKTFIHGRASTDTEGFVNDGCGEGALRCIMYATQDTWPCVQGFTITGGRTDSDPIGKWKASGLAKTPDGWQCYNWSAAAVCGWSWHSGGQIHIQVIDCVISNNVAYRATAGENAFFSRCVFTQNRTVNQANETNKMSNVGWLVDNSVLSSCVVKDNPGLTKGIVHWQAQDVSRIVNSTLIGDGRTDFYPFSSTDCGMLNSIFLDFAKFTYAAFGGNNIVWPTAGGWTAGELPLVADPLVADTSKYMARTTQISPAVDYGVYHDYILASSTFRTLDDKPLQFTAEGKTLAGCYGEAVPGCVVSANILTTSNDGVIAAEKGETVEITADQHPLEGFVVNGEFVPYATTGKTYTWSSEAEPAVTSLAALYSTNWYVNANATDDSGDGWSPATAKKTLNAILPLAIAGDCVHAAEGVYEGNEKLAADLTGSRIPFVGIIPDGVTLVADGEQGKTVVKGRWGGVGGTSNPYYTTGYQNMTFGDDAIRCLKAGANTKIKGLTIYNGGAHNTKYKDGTTTVAADTSGAGVYGTATTVFEDCFFSNLVAYTQAGFVGGGTAIRCKFIRLGSDGSGVCSSVKLYNCYIDRCFDSPVNGASVVKNCTLGPNNRVSFTSGDYPNSPINIASGGVLENTIMLIPNDSTATNINLRNVRNCIFEKSNQAKYNGTTWDANSKFVDAADVKLDADGHLCVGSVAIDAGVNDSLEEGKSAGIDLDGNKRISHKVVDVGCYEYMYRPTAFVKGIAGGIDPAEDVLVEIGTEQIVRATDDKRNVLSFEVKTNGVPVELEAGARSYVWTPTDEDDDLYVTATYATNWYVNAEAADDSGTGWTVETPKKTLAGVMEAVIAGDCVHAAPGVYNEGSMKHSDQCWLNGAVAVTNKCRVAIPEGAALVADGNAANTIIEGYKVAGSPSWPTFDSSGFGFSPDALRGVAMGPNSYLKGFTVTNCSVTGSAALESAKIDNNCGASILCKDDTAVIEDCFITRGAAIRGGGVFNGTYRRCKITFCFAVSMGGGSAGGSYYDCFFNACGDKVCASPIKLVNCTLGPHDHYWKGTADTRSSHPFAWWSSNTTILQNCLIMSPSYKSSAGVLYTNTYTRADNCIFAYLSDPGQVKITNGSNNQFVEYTELLAQYEGIGMDFVPKKGAISIDAGSNDFASAADKNGGQRVYNGTVDVGCYEYDWRPDYKADLRHSKIEVVEASPNVTEVNESNVQLVDGSTLKIKWPSTRGNPYLANFAITGGGELTITNEAGQLLKKCTSADTSYEIQNPGPDTELTFAFSGDGNATLLPFKSNAGLILLFR